MLQDSDGSLYRALHKLEREGWIRSVGQRSSEIGLRMALGATDGAVLQMILRHGLLLVAMGLSIGLGGALAASRLISGMLFDVT